MQQAGGRAGERVREATLTSWLASWPSGWMDVSSYATADWAVLLTGLRLAGTIEYALAEDRLTEEGDLWQPDEEDVTLQVGGWAGGALSLTFSLLR